MSEQYVLLGLRLAARVEGSDIPPDVPFWNIRDRELSVSAICRTRFVGGGYIPADTACVRTCLVMGPFVSVRPCEGQSVHRGSEGTTRGLIPAWGNTEH